LRIAQLMPLPLTVSCFSKIQIGLPFLVPAHLGSPQKRAVKRVSVCVCVCGRTAEYCNEYVCLCVWSVRLSASISPELQIQSSQKFFCMLPVAVGRSSSGNVAIGYVPLILWMTSCLHVMARSRKCENGVCS